MKSAKIHLLPDEIINKIAAGEVIERPASAVKELMENSITPIQQFRNTMGEVIERPASAVKELIENSIDAGATRIQVQIEEGGKKKILVSDNGKGMDREDLRLCYLRHTTSKLSKADDLFHLHTNGFRGEAVASIAAISKMTITTSTEDGEGGYLLTNYHIVKDGDVFKARWLDGTEMDIELGGFDDGTDIAVMRFEDAAPEGVEPIPMGDSDALQIGELAICIGNPGTSSQMLYGTVTAGT